MPLSLQGNDTIVQEAVQAAELASKYLARQRTGEAFHDFYEEVVDDSVDLTLEPTLLRHAKKSWRIDDGAPNYKF